jgi:DNA-binding transcriptional LysR family regulator
MVPTEAGQRLDTLIAGAIEKLESIPHKNSTAETPQTIRIGTPQEFFTYRLLGKLPQDDRTFYTVQFGLTAELIQQLKATKLDISMTYRLKMPKRRSSSFGVYFIQLPTAISMCQFCRNPRTQPICGRRV